MPFRINNTLTKADYQFLCKKLSKNRQSGEEDEEEEIFSSEEGKSIVLLDWQPLDTPLSAIGGPGWRGEPDRNNISTNNGETYSIAFTIKYESKASNNYKKVIESMRSSSPQGFDFDSGERLVIARKNGIGYTFNSNLDATVRVRTLTERKLKMENIKEDVENVTFLAEAFINTAYSTKNKTINFELATKISEKLGERQSILLMRRRRRMARSRKIVLERPTLTFDQIGGCGLAKEELTMLAHGLKTPESYRRWGINYPRGIILHGLPGTGKTMLAKAMANLAKASLYCVGATDVLTCYYGESPKMVGEVFDIAKKHAPAIILFDEIDSLVQRRGTIHEESGRIVSVFLQKMDGIKVLDKVTVIGTTNLVESIDPAILRPGRFDKIIEVTPPDTAAKAEIFRLHCNGRRVSRDIDFNALSEKCDGFTGADIAEVIQMSLGRKLKEELASNKDVVPVGFDDIMSDISEHKKRKEISMVVKNAPEGTRMYR